MKTEQKGVATAVIAVIVIVVVAAAAGSYFVLSGGEGGGEAALGITTTSLPDGTVNVAYSATLVASGGTSPYTWSIAYQSLPDGLDLSTGGTISGTPTIEGDFSFTVKVTDSDETTDTKVLSIHVASETEWIIETVDGEDNVGYYRSIALDSNGYPHVSYTDETNESLKYARWDGSDWSIEIVDDPNYAEMGDVSIAVDSDDHPHIIYYTFTKNLEAYFPKLKYAKWTGNDWDISIISADIHPIYECDCGLSIVVDSNDYPHIGYHAIHKGSYNYGRWNGSGWDIEVVYCGGIGAGSEDTSLALDSNDYPHMSFIDSADEKLKYARWNGSDWSIENVDNAWMGGEDISMTLDTNDYPHISYSNYSILLKYARWTGSDWDIETVDDPGPAGYVGYGNSIALDSNDRPHISYYNSVDPGTGESQDLRYARWNGSDWDIETVDNEGDVGYGTSIALDSNDSPHIIYYDLTNWDLKYARILPSQ